MNLVENIGFGCVSLTTLPVERVALKLLNTAFNEGITHFDTAPLYGNGYSEKIVGKFLKTKANKITVTTKFGLSPQGTISIPVWMALPLNHLQKKVKGVKGGPGKAPGSSEPAMVQYRKIDIYDVRHSFEKSIRSLQTGHINYFLLHEALPAFLTDEALHYLLILKKNGDVGKIGIAASYINLAHLQQHDLNIWDILQYENGLAYQSDKLVNVFAAQSHFYHSVFKGAMRYNPNIFDRNNITGILLAKAIKNNPRGKVLFGTSDIGHLRKNLTAITNCSQRTISEMNSMISDAIH